MIYMTPTKAVLTGRVSKRLLVQASGKNVFELQEGNERAGKTYRNLGAKRECVVSHFCHIVESSAP